MKILLAEDAKISRMALARHLQNWRHEVTPAEDGEQAWQQFSGGQFDIVITDWEMPRLSGLELVRRIRQTPREVYTYLIMLTGHAEKSNLVKGIEAGADDFVTKPFDPEELRVRLLAGERIIRLEHTLSRQNAELRQASERIHSGLQAAARVQQSMLPRHSIHTPQVSTAWKFVPTDELAGDAIGLYLIDGRYLAAYVMDASGHGVPAALLSVSAMHSMEPDPAELSLLRDVTRSGNLGTVQRPGRVAAELNRRFRKAEYDGRFLTMILCVLDIHEGRLHLTRAGHPCPFLLRGTDSISLPDAGGLPIAILDSAEYTDGCIQLRPGDRLCLFSDGVLEQPHVSRKEPFGATRLLDSLVQTRTSAVEQMLESVVGTLAAWAGSGSFSDDVSLVVVDWLGAV